MNVRLDGVTKRFGDVTALDDFSLTIASGEFMVVVGPSGCGKTTLLRLIAGLEDPDSGHLYLDGELADDIPVGHREVQIIFQNYALWPHMNVFDEQRYSNLSLPLKARRWTAEHIYARVQEVAQRVGLDSELFARKPDELSAGQQQRVALARAMTTSPRVFLMDEPITNLDPPARAKMRHEIRQLHDELGTTTLYVTHIMADAVAMADRIAFMRQGRLIQVGTAEQLWRYPADEFVRDFLAS